MKQAAVMLGVIGGILGLILGLSVSGWLAFTGWLGTEVQGDLPGALQSPENADLLRAAGVIAPILAIAGGAMAVLRPFWAAILLGGSALAMFWAFGLGFFTTFPIARCALAGLFALIGAASREPGGLTRG